MAKVCIQCDKKIGLFQKPLDGIYCSETCRDAAKAQIVEHERRSAELVVESQRAAEQQARQSAAAEAEASRRQSCAKCGKPWTYVQGGGPEGTNSGQCPTCGFSATFIDIETCPTCTGFSLLVAADKTARCPRCKWRRH